MMVWKMIFLFQDGILRFHVNLQGCNRSYFTPATTGDGAYLVGWGNNFLGNDGFTDHLGHFPHVLHVI